MFGRSAELPKFGGGSSIRFVSQLIPITPDWGCVAWRRLVARFQPKKPSRSDRDCSMVLRGYVSALAKWRCDCGPHHATARPSNRCRCRLQRPRAELGVQSLAPGDVSTLRPEPLKLPNSALEPIDWNALDGWAADDHAAAFTTFLTSCRPLLRTNLPDGTKRPVYSALTRVCRQALTAGRLSEDRARLFFERNFRPLRITKQCRIPDRLL